MILQSWVLLLLIFWSCNIGFDDGKKNTHFPKKIEWRELMHGLFYAELENPYRSKISDNIVTLVKADPKILDIDVYSNTSFDSVKRTAMCWSQDFNLNVVVNAGMYNLSNTFQAEGYLKSKKKLNNVRFKESFKMFALFKPFDSLNYTPYDMLDADIESLEGLLDKYQSAFQSIRMIDCNGKQVVWKPRRTIYSSMCVLGIDRDNMLLLAFTRSPMSANQMSTLLLHLPIHIRSAMYLEGGPEACLYIKTPDTLISKNGSYVSLTFPTDTNSRYWNLPNVIGIKVK
ncbi:MAG: phosphodiester glycosidase family protein [Bacteroidales bacterium]|nr:phosphodiester glycosidase family protein [Bacteroidales bacterium]